jgi:predicted ATPase/predicted Ser/Thr protein kinase
MRLALPQLEAGQLLAGYRVERMLGRGGMGVVYRARQLSLGRAVALKLLAPELASDEGFRARFRREAQLLASLEHPHVLPLYEAGEEEGLLFLAMRYVEGDDLGVLLVPGPLRPERACRIVTQLAAALQAAHERGLVHRDVKPANVLLTGTEGEEHAYLTDFGLARSLEGRGLTRTGEFLGSLDYLAPEQIEHGQADARSDIYALGCLLYACLTGQPPFAREQEAATLWAHLNAEPPAPSQLRPELPAALDDVIATALSKDPEQRYQTAAELARALDDALAGRVSTARGRKGQPKTNLPIQPTALIGRERELAELNALLRREDIRLLTLTGTGGTGKTRLALQLASDVIEEFRDGVFFVSLAPVSDPELVLATVAQTLGVREQPAQTLATTLADFLREKQLLLLLDNFEQVIDAAADVSALLQSCAKLNVLTTSRERLRVASERVHAVPPLRLPEQGADLAALATNEAVALFVARGQAADDRFTLTADNADAVSEICTRLDGLPLAIELAAARSAALPPGTLLKRLDQRLPLLTAGGRDAEERQRTLRRTIEWSYDLLTSEERELFASLGVFVGGWRLEAAQEVCSRTGDELELLDGLNSLVEKNLIWRRTDPDGEPRFWMLQTIREFALVALQESGEIESARGRHVEYFLALAERADVESRTGDQSAWYERLEADAANLRAVLDWTREAGEPERALRLATALWGYWSARGYISEGIRRLEEAVSLTRDPPARTVLGLCFLRELAGWESRDILDDAGRAVRAFEQLGDDFSLAQAWNLIGKAQMVSGSFAASERSFERALTYAERGNYPAERGESMGWLMISAVFGPLPTDRGIMRCTAFFENAGGDPKVRAFAQVERAVLEAMRGEVDVARHLLADGTRLFETLGLNVWAVNNAQEAFYVEMLAGNPPGASTVLRKSYEALEQMGERGFLSTIAGFLAHALCAQGEDEEAERFSRFSEDAAASDDVISQILWRTARAKVYARRGELARAEELAREAVELADPTDLLNTQADALSDLAEVLAAGERTEEAHACLIESERRYDRKANLVALRRTRQRADELAMLLESLD